MMAPETVVTVDHNKPSPQQAPSQQDGGGLDWLKINVAYFRTPPGILKIIQLIFGILCMSLVTANANGGTGWFCFVAVTAFITTLMWTIVYFLSIREALKLPINWVLSELVSTSIETVLYFIAFLVQFASASRTYHVGANMAAGVFGLFITIAYAASSYLLYQEHKAGLTGPNAA